MKIGRANVNIADCQLPIANGLLLNRQSAIGNRKSQMPQIP